MKKRFEAATREKLLRIFSELDEVLNKRSRTLSVVAVGGVSLILQGFRDRSTMDIDIANNADASAFQKICSERGIAVDIVTIASTVDFAHSPKVTVFQGKALTVDSIQAPDIIRSKLERFRKQDPEDIYAIIDKIRLPYHQFKKIVQDMLPYYIGNPREVALSALIVVEEIYPDHKSDFEQVVLGTLNS